MTTPPDSPNPPDREPGGWAAPVPAEPLQSDPQSLGQPETPFDPYRYGAPEQPVPPEYAPPATRHPRHSAPPAAQPPPYAPAQPAYGAQPGYGYQGGAAQPYPTPPHYSQQYPQPKTGNGKAVAALVLGILAIVFFWTSFIDIILIALGLSSAASAWVSPGGPAVAEAWPSADSSVRSSAPCSPRSSRS